MQRSIRIVFMGTPDFAVASLKALNEADNMDVIGVITAPDKPAGRGQKMQCPAVKQFALEQNISPILQPVNLKDEVFLDELKKLQADLFVVVAFRMLPEVVWNMPPQGTINLHASLLPQYRGAAPINWAIINGEKQTGVTTFFIEKEIDTGDIIDQEQVDISPNETAGSLHDKLMITGAGLLTYTVQNIRTSNVLSKKQSLVSSLEPAKTAPKIFKDDCLIQWSKSVTDVYNHIRGLSPYPAAWTQLYHKNEIIASFKIFACQLGIIEGNTTPGSFKTDNKTFLHIATSDGYIEICELQQAGKKRMQIDEFLRGYKFPDISSFK